MTGRTHPDHVETEWGWMPAPKFATERDHRFPSRGPRQARFSEVWLRSSLMPAQRMILDVAGELGEDGLPRYPLVVVPLQRRGGKSHLAMARKGERCFSVPGFRSWYTAQSGGDARDAFLKFGELVEPTPLGKIVRTLVGNGREVMRFPNGSTLRPHPPTDTALHGKESDDNDVDEAWAFSEAEGRALLQAISPTQLTRPGAQTWILSAGGTAESTWLAELVSRGREGDPTIAYFEFGIPDDADADDLEAIAACHPAYGHTIGMAGLRNMRAQFGDDVAGWARAAGNRWTEVIGGAIPDRLWESWRSSTEIPEGVPVGYGAARSADGTQVAIAAGAVVDGRPLVDVVDVLRTSFGAGAVIKGWATDGPVAVAPEGASATLADALDDDDAGAQLMRVGSRDYSVACANVMDGAVRFRQHPELDAARRVAAKRSVGDGGFVWSRTTAGPPIATLEAATLAAWAATHRAPDPGPPLIDFGN